jgi:RNA polymerase sigma-70 factor (ECF subfamily)
VKTPDGPSQGSDDFDRLYHDIAPTLWRAIYAYTGGRRAIADDAVAEAFARAMENRIPIRSPRAWLYRTAFRIAAAELRKERERREETDDVIVEPELREVLEALKKLSPSQRAAVFLHYEADLPVREVARVMGSTEPAIRVHLHRGRARLRKILGGQEVDDA